MKLFESVSTNTSTDDPNGGFDFSEDPMTGTEHPTSNDAPSAPEFPDGTNEPPASDEDQTRREVISPLPESADSEL